MQVTDWIGENAKFSTIVQTTAKVSLKAVIFSSQALTIPDKNIFFCSYLIQFKDLQL